MELIFCRAAQILPIDGRCAARYPYLLILYCRHMAAFRGINAMPLLRRLHSYMGLAYLYRLSLRHKRRFAA